MPLAFAGDAEYLLVPCFPARLAGVRVKADEMIRG